MEFKTREDFVAYAAVHLISESKTVFAQLLLADQIATYMENEGMAPWIKHQAERDEQKAHNAFMADAAKGKCSVCEARTNAEYEHFKNLIKDA